MRRIRTGGRLHKILALCDSNPLTAVQIQARHEAQWDEALSLGNIHMQLCRLLKLGYLARPVWAEYHLTPLGREWLDTRPLPPPLPSSDREAAALLRSVLDGTYVPHADECMGLFSSEALDRTLDLLEARHAP